ncbi:MAG: transposase [Desulfobacteraceae bacterium]|nr:transposase [Desulfobacteraceae bacterium]
MNRGRRSEEIFSDAEDFATFLELLLESVELWDVKVSSYCLMSNHYHLLIQTPRGNLSRFMRHLNGIYTQRYNRAHRCEGQLFRGRYKAILVEEDSYLLELVRYIHRNPLRAGIATEIDQYPWSSHHGYLSSAKKWSWLHKDFIMSMLTGEPDKGFEAYCEFVVQEDSEEISRLFDKKKLPAILGREKFVNWVKITFFEDKVHSQVPESVQLAPEVESIKKAVCLNYGIEKSHLLQSERGVSNEPRNVAIYLTRVLRRDGLIIIGSSFGMQGYSSASSAVERVRKRLKVDKELRQRIAAIKQDVINKKSQTET